MYMAVKHFKYFLEGRSFKIVTDQKSTNRAILALSTNLSQRQSKRWRLNNKPMQAFQT